GVAKVAAHFAKDERYSAKCLPVLQEMCNDSKEAIREIAAGAFYSGEILNLPNASLYLERFVESRAFIESGWRLFDLLQNFGRELAPFANIILAAYRRALRPESHDMSASKNWRWLWDANLSSLILRLYEQLNSPSELSTRNECLDVIDDMLFHHFDPVVSQLRELD
ncbi:MAG: hypothetical protein J0M26_18120, partial [Planctomycetes bacterium]|nr:hypothetical protein [Planctomycetota bacterium]